MTLYVESYHDEIALIVQRCIEVLQERHTQSIVVHPVRNRLHTNAALRAILIRRLRWLSRINLVIFADSRLAWCLIFLILRGRGFVRFSGIGGISSRLVLVYRSLLFLFSSVIQIFLFRLIVDEAAGVF